MKLLTIYNRRKDLKENSMYRWSDKSHKHIIFKKLTTIIDEIYYKNQFIGTVAYYPHMEECIFEFSYHLNDYDRSNGSTTLVRTFEYDGDDIISSLYMFKGINNDSLISTYNNQLKSKIYSLKNNPLPLKEEIGVGIEIPNVDSPRISKHNDIYIPKVIYGPIDVLNARLGATGSFIGTYTPSATKISFTSLSEESNSYLHITPKTDYLKLYDNILKDITELSLVTFDSTLMSKSFCIWNENNKTAMYNFKLANYVLFLKKFNKYIGSDIDCRNMLNENRFFNLNSIHNIIIGESDFEIEINTSLFDVFEYMGKQYDLKKLKELLDSLQTFPYTMIRKCKQILNYIL